MDRFGAPAYLPDMQITLDKKPAQPAQPAPKTRTRYAIHVSELAAGEWLADLAPSDGRPGLTLRGATAKEAFEKMLEFLFA